MPSNHLIFCCPLLLLPSIFPSIKVFSNQSVLCNRSPKYWSFSFSISPSNIYSGLIPLAWTGWISLQSKGLSRVFSNTTVQKHHTVCDPLGLAFLIWCHVFEVHPCDSAYQFCFCWLSNNKQYVTKPCIYHQLMELWVGSTLGLLIMLLWTLIYMFLCGHVFISLWWDFILKFHRLI